MNLSGRLTGCKRGFSVIELVLVLVFVGILAAVVVPMAMRSSSSIGVASLGKKIGDDIRYAQSLAMSRSKLESLSTVNDPKFVYRVIFNVNISNPADPNYPIFINCPGTNKYTIVSNEDNNAFWGENPNALGVTESAKNPSTGAQYFCVQLGTGDYQGFAVSANFGGTIPGILEFDVNGVPYNSDRIKITAPNNAVTLTKGGETAIITVTPNTGWVQVR